jgi:hypothetical protein
MVVAETSGRMSGLPEGDLGPLIPRSSSSEEENGDGDDCGGENVRKTVSKRKKEIGATLDAKAIDKLLGMLCDEKVRESIFGSSALS